MITSIILASSLLAFSEASPQANDGFSITVERTSRSARSLQARGEHGTSAVRSIYGGLDWVTSVRVGNQVLRALIDTGSSDLWFGSVLLDDATKQQYPDNKFFDPNSSPTWFKSADLTFNISYDNGELGAAGLVGSDAIEIGGVTAAGMTFGVATSLYGSVGAILDSSYDGTMGLGWGSLQSRIFLEDGTSYGAPTFMQSIQDQLSKPVFACNFRPNHRNTISFGFVNDSLHDGNLQTVDINNSTGFWTSPNVTFSSGGTPLGVKSMPMIFDTGGLGTSVSEEVAKAYYALIPGSANIQTRWTFPCSTPKLPDLTFHFLNTDGSISNATISGASINVTAASDQTGTICAGGLQQSGNGVTNVGNAFFETFLTVFDQSAPTVQFAKYADVEDTAGTNEADLPTATDARGFTVPTASSSGSSTTSNSTISGGSPPSSSQASSAGGKIVVPAAGLGLAAIIGFML